MALTARLFACALVTLGWAGLTTHAAARDVGTPAALAPNAIVSAIDDCFGAFPAGKFDASKLAEPRWHSGRGEMDDGSKLPALRRDDGAILTIGERVCIVKNPLASDSSIDDLAKALTDRWAIQPRPAGGDLRWVVAPGFVQIHRQSGSPTGKYLGVIVQANAGTEPQ